MHESLDPPRVTGVEPRLPSVLVVDDTPWALQLLAEGLGDEYVVAVAASGEEALNLAGADPQPDAILLDVVMPGMDGHETCRRLKSDVRTRDIPIIFITAESSPRSEVEGLDLGAVDYIAKPVNLAIVRARLRTHVQLHQRTRLLERLALMDGLTGVANRQRFEDALVLEWQRALRSHAPLSVLFVDLDRFKVYNDRFGHGIGDEVLRRVARLAQSVARRPADLVARYGGDEFVVLLPDTPEQGATEIAEELTRTICSSRAPIVVDGTPIPCSASVGSATVVPTPEMQPAELVSRADAAAYGVKRAGRDDAP